MHWNKQQVIQSSVRVLAVLAQFSSILGHCYIWACRIGSRWPFLLIEGCYHIYLMVTSDWLAIGYLIQFRAEIVTSLSLYRGLRKTRLRDIFCKKNLLSETLWQKTAFWQKLILTASVRRFPGCWLSPLIFSTCTDRSCQKACQKAVFCRRVCERRFF
jgi:hypothetical protein